MILYIITMYNNKKSETSSGQYLNSVSDFLSFIKTKRNCKPGYVVNDHLSGTDVATGLKRPTWKHDGQPYCFLFGLASDGVYMCPVCYQPGGSLLHCPSTLTRTSLAVHFCCTILGVTSTGRYPASCPAKPGLSSDGTFRPAARDHLFCFAFGILAYSFGDFKPRAHIGCFTVMLYLEASAAQKLS